MEQKKISFGFNKVIRKSILLPNKPKDVENKIELIKCLEGQSIKLINQEQNKEETPLVIPMKDGGKTSAALASLKLRQEILNGNINNSTEDNKKEQPVQPVQDGQEESVEQRAVRELLKEAHGENVEEDKNSNLMLPIKPDELPLEGAIEPTLDDYDSIPVTQFGLAMLRGMGWKDEEKKKATKDEEGPILRPKGMGLGADKVLKRKALLIPPEANEKLEIKKTAFVRILGGKYKDMYGQIEGLDDHAGRVIVKLALGGNRESLNEFMVQPVSKREYSEYGKVINSAKYEQYKKMENEYGQIVMKAEDIKSEHDVSEGNIRGYRGDKISSTRRRSHHSPASDDEAFKSSAMSYSKREGVGSNLKVKNENKEEKREKNTSSKPSKYSSHTFDDRNKSRNKSPQHDRSHNSRDDRNRRQSTSEEDSSDPEDNRKSKKKSKKKSKERHRHRHDSSEDDKRHKKKTKKSKRPRSRSRQRR